MTIRFVTVGDDFNLPTSVHVPVGNLTGNLGMDNTTDGAAKVALTVTERAKLSGIATAATANDTDANLKNRANHTGAQAISTVTGLQAAIDAKAPSASPTFTGTVAGIDKTMVGLTNVDNTSDASKPVSTATQTALNLKANAASPAFTGTPTGLTKTHVGLANVDNTSDANKPVSTAQQTALDAKAAITPAANVGLDYGIAFSNATGLGARPTLPAGAKLRIYGGTSSDTDPSWMIDGDYRDIVVP